MSLTITALMISLFGGISVAALYIVLRRILTNRALTHRLAGLPMNFSKETATLSRQSGQKSEEITLEDVLSSSGSGMKKDLYLAGLRTKKAFGFYRLAQKGALVLPIILILIQLLTGKFNNQSAIQLLFLGVGFYFLMTIMVKKRKVARQKRLLRELPQFLDILVVAVEAGLSFTAAIERMLTEVDQKEPLTKEFNVMYREYLTGLSLAQACKRLDQRCEVPELTFIINSIVQSEQLGSSLGHTLRVQAVELRDKIRQKIREKALKIPIKILFPILPLFFNMFVFTLGPAGYQLAKFFMGGNSPNQNSSQVNQ